MSGISAYYQILGVTEKASLDEIKRAYRKKALLLHPDRNPSPTANEEFIRLTKAYDFLLQMKVNGIRYPQTTSTSRPQQTYTPPPRPGYTKPQSNPQRRASSYEEQVAWRRAEARRRAGQMKQTEDLFEKTIVYKIFRPLDIVFTHIVFVIGMALLFALPVSLLISGEWVALLVILIFYSTLSPVFFVGIKRALTHLKFKSFFKALWEIARSRWFAVTGLSVINFFVILKIGMQTLIYPWVLLLAYIIPGFIMWFACYYSANLVKKNNRLFYTFCLAPLFISVLLMLNFWGSSNPAQETYRFYNKQERMPSKYEESSMIILEGNRYGKYPGIRTFADYEQMLYKTHITYVFEDGLLGLRVMKAYEFSK